MEKDVIFLGDVYTYDELMQLDKDNLIFMLRLSCDDNILYKKLINNYEKYFGICEKLDDNND